MKTTKLLIVFTIIAVFFLSSCENPTALGEKLDLEGPLVDFTYPSPRSVRKAQFSIEGTALDPSGTVRLLLTAEFNRDLFAKQWRYQNGKWEISENFGASWAPFSGATVDGESRSARWTGTNNVSWSIPVDMLLTAREKQENKLEKVNQGEYLFMVQAWDAGGQSDENSFKSIVIIVDTDPPAVQVIDPYLYDRHAAYSAETGFSNKALQDLHVIKDDDLTESRNPVNIGKFLTRGFNMKWQIDDQHDIWSVDILFYNYDVNIDGYPATPIPDGYYFRHHENLGPPPDTAIIGINPNGSIAVPALTDIKEKTTIRVVSVCYDAAGNPNEEKTLGYFVYWPRADEPWIAYTEGMYDPDEKEYYKKDVTEFASDIHMIYPGRSIKATAFQAHGVSKVEYALFQCEETSEGAPGGEGRITKLTGKLIPIQEKLEVIINEPREVMGNKILSTNFPWEFSPPPRSGYYVVTAYVYDVDGEYGKEKFTALFRVQDISFPDFTDGPYPSATEPLFKFIGASNGEPEVTVETAGTGEIIISGKVSDATEITSLLMVWINPESENYSAMSQLQYFRDPAYQGWADAEELTVGDAPKKENWKNESTDDTYPYDPTHPNKLWKLLDKPQPLATDPAYIGEDPETRRQVFHFSQPVKLKDDLGIDIDDEHANPLRKQTFLLKVKNPDNKSTVIIYAPPGDELPPKITIKDVKITKVGSTVDLSYNPGEFAQIPQFAVNDKITINGEWVEDSAEYLNVNTYLYSTMEFTVNDIRITNDSSKNTTVTYTTTSGSATSSSGTFKIEATLGIGNSYALHPDNIKDTLVVNTKVRDIGGNPAEHGASWLIQSDKLRFLRISSEKDDAAYRSGEQIKIFIEFNKPVVLKSGRSRNPTLLVNAGGNATTNGVAQYDSGLSSESTRHYFTYTVGASDNTDRLNVTGISIDGSNTPLAATSTDWQNANYPFTFVYTAIDGSKEEVRLTMDSAHVTSDASRNGINVTSQVTPAPSTNEEVFARLVPVNATNNTTTNPDYVYTLAGGKNISVDNTPPTITGITATPAGWHRVGEDIYITATFSEPVKLGTTLPRLNLNSATGRQTTNTATDVRVNGDKITFRYTVQANDTTGTNELQVTGFTGNILDIPGNALATLSSTSLTGVYIDTAAPGTPTIAVYSGVNGVGTPTQITGTTLGALYDDNLFIRFTGTGTAGDNVNLGKVEYSLNGSGTNANWIPSTTPVTNIVVRNKELHQVSVRQTDQAGNQSSASAITSFTWDPGPLISRISSTSPNGTYTHQSNSTNGSRIIITVTFRKSLTFAAGNAPAITINARTASVTTTIATATTTNTLSFTYDVANGDATSLLDVTNISGFTTVTDTDTGATVNVGRYLNGTNGSTLPTAAGARLAQNKEIKVQTGTLSNPTPTFINETTSPWTTTDQTSQYYQGIRSDDGSYWTTLQIQFNNDINKGSGDITIEQIQGTANASYYRLPTVLTEAQYNRFRNIANFNTYYTKGTNGYINGQGSDTSAKYVLNYQYNPLRGASDAFTGDTLVPTAFSDDFRTAERITLNVNSQSVEIVNGNTLKVRLTGSNAPQVPGATYQITYPAGLVTDILGNSSAARTNTQVTLGGVAKPFVRIKKTQDIIGNRQTAGATTPTLTATQPQNAYVRMDGRTPNSTIVYWQNTQVSATSTTNWGAAAPGGTTPAAVAPTRPTVPATGTGSSTPYNGQITIGNANHEGLKWYVVARASATVGGIAYTNDSDEVAYRTAITYRLAGLALADTTGQQFMRQGGQIWIRGGDSLGSSSIPGFPLTWEDNFTSLRDNQKRAGIRLMTIVANTWPNGGNMGTSEAGTSTWQFLTWEINATAYVDFILGHDRNEDNINNYNTYESASINEVWQYGPRYWALQRGGWAPSKALYPIYPGEIRYLATNVNNNSVNMNFSAAFNSRPSNGRQNATTPTGNTLPVTVPNPNTNN